MPPKFPTEEILAEGENENGATNVHINGYTRNDEGPGRQDWNWSGGKRDGKEHGSFYEEPDYGAMAAPMPTRRRKR